MYRYIISHKLVGGIRIYVNRFSLSLSFFYESSFYFDLSTRISSYSAFNIKI